MQVARQWDYGNVRSSGLLRVTVLCYSCKLIVHSGVFPTDHRVPFVPFQPTSDRSVFLLSVCVLTSMFNRKTGNFGEEFVR
jgi:hypothetical protein